MGSMKHLGTFSKPVLIFGGPYSNVQATTALLDHAQRKGFLPENIICTGDVVAYAGDPAPTTDMIIQSGMHVVMGNCEESLGAEGDDCGCGFDAGSACDLLSRQWYAYANSALGAGHRAWMRALPRQLRFSMAGLEMAVIHGGVSDISRWIFRSSDMATKQKEIDEIERSGLVDVIIGGHCGLPFADDLNDKLWLNAGVIGMPANDGTARTWYMILSPSETGVQIELCTLDYDHVAAAQRMRELGLADAYAKTLIDGIWPNMDVLPGSERQHVGHPLKSWQRAWSRSTSTVAQAS